MHSSCALPAHQAGQTLQRLVAAAWTFAALAMTPQAMACSVQKLHLMSPIVSEVAQVGMVGHVDNGTKSDDGRYKAELVVTAQLVADIAASQAGGCQQWIRHAAGGNIVLLGQADGSYEAKSQVDRIDGVTGDAEKLTATFREQQSGATPGGLTYVHDATFKRGPSRRLAVGDRIRLSAKATAVGTIIDGWVDDQVQVLYEWNGPAPYVEILVP